MDPLAVPAFIAIPVVVVLVWLLLDRLFLTRRVKRQDDALGAALVAINFSIDRERTRTRAVAESYDIGYEVGYRAGWGEQQELRNRIARLSSETDRLAATLDWPHRMPSVAA